MGCHFLFQNKEVFPNRASLVYSSASKESACNAGDPGSIPGLGRSPGEGVVYPLQYSWPALVVQSVKNQPAKCKTWVLSLGWEDPWEEGILTQPPHYCSLLWEQSMIFYFENSVGIKKKKVTHRFHVSFLGWRCITWQSQFYSETNLTPCHPYQGLGHRTLCVNSDVLTVSFSRFVKLPLVKSKKALFHRFWGLCWSFLSWGQTQEAPTWFRPPDETPHTLSVGCFLWWAQAQAKVHSSQL